MTEELDRNERLQPDPELAAYLRWLDDLPEQSVDWAALERSIHQRAELPLAMRRAELRRTQLRRRLVPLAVAAGLAALALMELPGRVGAGVDTPPEPSVAAAHTLEDVLRTDLSDQEFQLLISGHDNPDALLQIAATRD